MSRWTIYGKDDSIKHESITGSEGDGEQVWANSLEYHGTRMGERFVAVTIKSPYPIDFAIGDYLIYRDERFELNYIPTVQKQAKRGKYGEGFVYSNIKFNSLADELVRNDFLDIVLNDNQVHYTSMPNFSFYAETVDDLLDRIQANIDTLDGDVTELSEYMSTGHINNEITFEGKFMYNGKAVECSKFLRSDGFTDLLFKVYDGSILEYATKVKTETNVYGFALMVSPGDNLYEYYEGLFENGEKLDVSIKYQWRIFSPSKSRSVVRGCSESEWYEYYGYNDTTPDYSVTNQMIDISNQKCWNALLLSYSTFKLPFIVRGRNVYVGSSGSLSMRTFRFGRNNGLAKIENKADDSQAIITRLRAYGSTENLPYKYYALRYGFPRQYWNNATPIYVAYSGYGYYFVYISNNGEMFPDLLTNEWESTGSRSSLYPSCGRCRVSVTTTYEDAKNNTNIFQLTLFENKDCAIDEDEEKHYFLCISDTDWAAIQAKWQDSDEESNFFYFVDGVNKSKCPYTAMRFPDSSHSVPDNMEVLNLMLPGFPGMSLYDWVKSHGGTDCNDDTGRATWNGHTAYFSKDRLRPYIDSLTIDDLGLRPQSEFFDGSDDKEEVHPTLKEMTIGDLMDAGVDTASQGWNDRSTRVDEIQMIDAYKLSDDGYEYEEDKSKDVNTGVLIDMPSTFDVDIPYLGFDLKKAISEAGADCSLSATDGMLGGREFKIASVEDTTYIRGGKSYWKVTCKRLQDSSIGIFFPNGDYNFSTGDHYVLTGINLPDMYVDTAAVRLLRNALPFLDKYDNSRAVSAPTIDEIFMSNEHRNVIKNRENGTDTTTKSLYESIEEGAIFNIEDDDLGDMTAPIDTLIIKENGNNGIPTYSITLRDEKDTGGLQKTIESIANDALKRSYGSGYSGRGSYISKLYDDTAAGVIGFIKGLWVKASGVFGFSEEGDVTARSLKSTGTNGETITDGKVTRNLGLKVEESGVIGGILRVAKAILTKTIQSLNFSGAASFFGSGWQITDNDGNGNSVMTIDNVFIRGKLAVNELEVRKLTAMGGNYVFSPAASVIEAVDYIDENNEVLGYSYMRVPWVLRLIPIKIANKILTRMKWVRVRMKNEDWEKVFKYRCWLKADEGSTRTINTWRVGMMARCQTFNTSIIENGTHSGSYSDAEGEQERDFSVVNKLYWRAVVDVGENIVKDDYELTTIVLDDEKKHSFIDLSNKNGYFLPGSDRVSAGDHIVCLGDYIDKSLSNAITLETVGTDAPSIKEMVNIGYEEPEEGADPMPVFSITDDNIKTRISPVAGSRFVAPYFIIESTGEYLHNINKKGTTWGWWDAENGYDIGNRNMNEATKGCVILNTYTDFNDGVAKIQKCTTSYNPLTRRSAIWGSGTVALGDAYVCDLDGHLYEATSTGWEDLGLVTEDYSSLKVLADSITAEVTRIKKGKNLLSGVLTAKDWLSSTDTSSFPHSAKLDDENWIEVGVSDDTILASPVFEVEGGKQYAVSFNVNGESDVNVLIKNTDNSDYDISLLCVISDDGRHSGIFTPQITGGVRLCIYATPMRFPQVEVGNMATAFDAGFVEASGLLSVTADKITASVTQNENRIASLEITAEGLEAKVAAIKSGKNVLSGVLTAIGWYSGTSPATARTSAVLSDNYISVGSSSHTVLVSPAFTMEAGIEYAISFETDSINAINIALFDASTLSRLAVWSTDSGDYRHVATFGGFTEDKSVVLAISHNKVKYPQVEVGTSATEFEANDKELSSAIKQTADGISANVTENANKIAALELTADGLSSTVSEITQGKNKLTGVLTSEGWYSGSDSNHALILEDDSWMEILSSYGDSIINSPAFEITSGKTYAVSFENNDYDSIDLQVVKSNDSSTYSPCTTCIVNGRHVVYFSAPTTGSFYLRIACNKLRYPQVELGSSATEFEASGKEISSAIKQTADNIVLKVGETGININDGTIDLKAGKVTFSDKNGENTNAKIWIDSENGTLHATGFVKRERTIISQDNQAVYTDDTFGTAVISFQKTGSFVDLYGWTEEPTLAMPIWSERITELSAYQALSSDQKQAYKDDIFSYIGTKLLIYNRSGFTLSLVNNLTTSTYGISISNGYGYLLECVIEADGNGKENVYWKQVSFFKIINA